MAKDLDELMLQYMERLEAKPPPGSQECAELEDEIWEKRKRSEGRGLNSVAPGEKRVWFSNNFGGSGVPYEKRGTILRAGRWAWVCFERLDKGTLNYTNATMLVRVVKNVSRSTGAEPSKVMTAALKMYKGTVRSLDGLREAVAGEQPKPKARAKPKAPVVDETAPYSAHPNASSKEFRARINQVVGAYLDHIFKSNPVNDWYKGQLKDEFMAGIDVNIGALRAGIQSSKKSAGKEIIAAVSRSDFELACEVLGLSLKYGAAIDPKTEKLIARRFHHRAGGLHPDKNDSQEAREEYENVTNAYETLKTYVRIRKEAS